MASEHYPEMIVSRDSLHKATSAGAGHSERSLSGLTGQQVDLQRDKRCGSWFTLTACAVCHAVRHGKENVAKKYFIIAHSIHIPIHIKQSPGMQPWSLKHIKSFTTKTRPCRTTRGLATSQTSTNLFNNSRSCSRCS